MDIHLIWKGAIVAAALAAAGIAHYVFKAKDDNSVEQLAEKVIEKETGLAIDLTPETTSQKAL